MSNEDNDGPRYKSSQANEPQSRNPQRRRRLTPPGRIPGEDSVEASRENDPKDDNGYDYTGFETPAATRIGKGTADDPEIERLRKHHHGRHQSDGKHSARETERDKERVPEAICSALSLTHREREQVVTLIKHLDFGQFGNQRSIIKVTLGVVAVMVDENWRDGADELDQLIRRSEEFREIRDAHDISMSDMTTVKQTVRDILESESVVVNSPVRKLDSALPESTPPEDLPRRYWEELPSESWVSIARTWDKRPEELKEAIPTEYNERIRLLRKWEPWTEHNESEVQDIISSPEESTDFDEGSAAEEVEELIRESESSDRSDSQ